MPESGTIRVKLSPAIPALLILTFVKQANFRTLDVERALRQVGA